MRLLRTTQQQVEVANKIHEAIDGVIQRNELGKLREFLIAAGARIIVANPPLWMLQDVLEVRETFALSFADERRQWFEAAYKCGLITDADLDRIGEKESGVAPEERIV